MLTAIDVEKIETSTYQHSVTSPKLSKVGVTHFFTYVNIKGKPGKVK
jgi:hypothetical protein